MYISYNKNKPFVKVLRCISVTSIKEHVIILSELQTRMPRGINRVNLNRIILFKCNAPVETYEKERKIIIFGLVISKSSTIPSLCSVVVKSLSHSPLWLY